jgi:nitroreductase
MITVEARQWFDGDLSQLWPKTPDIFPDTPNYDYLRFVPPTSLRDYSFDKAARLFIEIGRMAPSSHNIQPWRFEIDESGLSLHIRPDTQYIGGPSDKVGREAMIGVGTCAENILLALAAYSLQPNAVIMPRHIDGKNLAEVTIEIQNHHVGELVQPSTLELIRKRRVYRGPFVRTSINPVLWSQLVDAGSQPGIAVNMHTDMSIKRALGLVQYTADNVVLQNREFRQELGKFMGSNASLETRIMPGNTFGLNDDDAELLQQQLSDGGPLRNAFAAGMPTSDKDAIMSATGIVSIISDADTPENWIKTGVAMERIWLLSQAKGMGVGIMAGMVEVATKALELMRISSSRGYPTGIMRIGVPARDTWPRSPRVSLDEIIEPS